MTTRSTFRTSLFSWKKANKPMCVVGFAVAGSKNFSQRNKLINKPKTSRHGPHDKQVAHRNEANSKSERKVCGSTTRFHYDFETPPLPTGSRNISMRSDRLSGFLHTTTLKRQLATHGCEATFVETKHVQFQTTRQIRHLHGFGERRGPLIPHVVASEIEVLQGGVRLAVLHSSDYPCQRTSAYTQPVTHHCTRMVEALTASKCK